MDNYTDHREKRKEEPRASKNLFQNMASLTKQDNQLT